PDFQLTTTEGEEFDLGALRGKTVLLYFQEGIGCQPCWDQLTDLEPRFDEFEALGIDEIATITTDPPDLLAQKVADEGITTPVMTDLNLTVSDAYSTPDYRMAGMSESFNGHSFVLVDEDGMIEWRADYGGPSTGNTMYVPVESLLADIEHGINGAGS
ncbi:MAG: peroxiredoxin family protein, partial [Thermoleophilaceae bacterium]